MLDLLAAQLVSLRAQVGALQAQIVALEAMVEAAQQIPVTAEPAPGPCTHPETEETGTFGAVETRCTVCKALVAREELVEE